jgi:hypothetical protein
MLLLIKIMHIYNQMGYRIGIIHSKEEDHHIIIRMLYSNSPFIILLSIIKIIKKSKREQHLRGKVPLH